MYNPSITHILKGDDQLHNKGHYTLLKLLGNLQSIDKEITSEFTHQLRLCHAPSLEKVDCVFSKIL